MNVTGLQSRLGVVADGDLGPQTMTALLTALAPRAPSGRLAALGKALPASLKAHDIWTPNRVQHFLAQALHESGGLQWMGELGGPTYFKKYDGRRDLGNTQPGDGYRYRGRGIFQLTGRANYTAMGKRLGLDLVGSPELAAEAATAAEIAALYWEDRGINAYADTDDIAHVTRKINGGLNGLQDRAEWLAKVRGLWS